MMQLPPRGSSKYLVATGLVTEEFARYILCVVVCKEVARKFKYRVKGPEGRTFQHTSVVRTNTQGEPHTPHTGDLAPP